VEDEVKAKAIVAISLKKKVSCAIYELKEKRTDSLPEDS
jgi:hypothetical protein